MPRNLELERELLNSSEILDESFYIHSAGEEARLDPADHYIRVGWLNNIEPNAEFPGSFLRPYFASIGLEGPPAVTWAMLRSAGWPLPRSHAELRASVFTLRSTELFDESFYAQKMPSSLKDLDPTVHYAVVGERSGICPSPDFDPAYYLQRYPDISSAGISCLQHYLLYGRAEGRNARPFPALKRAGKVVPSGKPSVLLVMHEASRTGAPVLGWNIARYLAKRYNLHIVSLGDGPLLSNFQDLSVALYGPFPMAARSSEELEFSLRDLLETEKFEYAVVNSIESRYVLQACARRYIPTVLLMHEFASYTFPLSSMRKALDWATEIVFPASLVAQSAEAAYKGILNRQVHILPQGISLVPERDEVHDEDFLSALHDIAEKKRTGTFVVVAAGTVHIRKGVDVFLSIAAAAIRRGAVRNLHFVWVGQGYYPKEDVSYSAYLKEQIQRSGIEGHVTFMGEAPSLDPVYAVSDVFVLSSRLDPLPNVSIDAAVHGLPIVCFREASGMASLLLGDSQTAECVVDYLDTEAAARIICRLAEEEDFRSRTSNALRRLARKRFDMASYTDELDRIGKAGSLKMRQKRTDAEVIDADSAFDQDMFVGPAPILESRHDSILRYLVHRDQPLQSHPRRPCPGFHPRVYIEQRNLDSTVDPLADFIRSGKPSGRWQTKVITPENPDEQRDPSGQLRVALHCHMFYPQFLPYLLALMSSNRTRCDLLISTDEVAKADEMKRATKEYENGCIEIKVFPNKGRDLGPFLSGFAAEFRKYDVIGHVHSKRSENVFASDTGDRWREFLWQRLLGDRCRMMDRIIAEFEAEDRLGLVFPSDPHLVGWDENRPYGAKLAVRMGWQGPLPDSFDFPLGTMFWIRPQALQPLLDLKLGWDDYPQEPLPYDGTILHALERLLPFSAQIAGYSFAVTHLSAVDW